MNPRAKVGATRAEMITRLCRSPRGLLLDLDVPDLLGIGQKAGAGGAGDDKFAGQRFDIEEIICRSDIAAVDAELFAAEDTDLGDMSFRQAQRCTPHAHPHGGEFIGRDGTQADQFAVVDMHLTKQHMERKSLRITIHRKWQVAQKQKAHDQQHEQQQDECPTVGNPIGEDKFCRQIGNGEEQKKGRDAHEQQAQFRPAEFKVKGLRVHFGS